MSKKQEKEPLFYRSIHLTGGGLFLVLPVLIWAAQGSESSAWPLYAWILYFCLPIIGVGWLAFGILASDTKINSIRIGATPNNFVMAILAVPLYLVLKGIRQRKREQALRRKHDHPS
jgi:hypothetical protein